jgi:flagellar biosynthesis chaperone FliJ
MATKKIQAKLKVAGEILAEFQNTHFLNQATDIQQALELLDQAIKDLEQTEEDLSAQVNGENNLFQTVSSFTNLQVFLNGLEQTPGENNDYIIIDDQRIRFHRNLESGETIKVRYQKL